MGGVLGYRSGGREYSAEMIMLIVVGPVQDCGRCPVGRSVVVYDRTGLMLVSGINGLTAPESEVGKSGGYGATSISHLGVDVDDGINLIGIYGFPISDGGCYTDSGLVDGYVQYVVVTG